MVRQAHHERGQRNALPESFDSSLILSLSKDERLAQDVHARGRGVLRVMLLVAASVIALNARSPEILQSVNAMPAHVAGRFRTPIGYQQSSSGQYFVFDRRAHTVFGVDAEQ